MIKRMLALAVVLWSGLAFADTPTREVFDVRNITCAACGITIEKALERVPGVTATQVDADKATVTVDFDADRTNAPAVAKAISDAGFPATPRRQGG
jgi:mercuric transport protein